MGQGLYRGLGVGMLNPPPELSEDDAFGDLAGFLHFSYEAEPSFGCALVGVDDECLQEWWSVGALPDLTPSVKDYTARNVRHLTSGPAFHRQFAIWELVRKVAAERGLRLPKGRLISFCDWD